MKDQCLLLIYLFKYFNPRNQINPINHGSNIITKEHKGTIKVKSNEGEGSTFIINLPV